MRNELFRKKIEEEFEERSLNQKSYSIRKFAKDLNLSPSSLNQIINGKRPLTDKMCLKIAKELELESKEISHLMGIRKIDSPKKSFSNFNRISVEQVNSISKWYHYAILELTYLKHFKADYEWIAKVLNIKIENVYKAVHDLQDVGFLKITEKGTWIDLLGDTNNFGNDYTAPTLRDLQKQNLQKGIYALENIPYEERVQSSITLPVSKKRVSLAKKKILNFLEELDSFLKEDEEADDIFTVSVSLFPISQTKKVYI